MNSESEELLLQCCAKNKFADVERLIKSGVNINCTSNFGWTPLMQAAEYNHKVILLFLLKNGADFDKQDIHGILLYIKLQITDITKLLFHF